MIQAQNIATENPVGQLPVVLNLGTVTASAADVYKVALPFYAARLRRVDVYAGGTVSGTTPTLSVTVAGAASGTLATTADVTAAGLFETEADAPITLPYDQVSVSTTVGGTTPSFDGVWVTLWFSLTDNRDVSGSTAPVAY